MHVHSFVPIAGFTLLPLVFSANLPSHGLVVRDDLIICDHLPTPWTHSGCFSDSTSNRVLPLDSYCDDTGLSEEKCIEYCDSKGYSYAGVEYGQECYCGYELASSAVRQDDSDCNMACTGNTEERCGGSSRINVFTNGDPAPQVNPGANGFTSLGCYTDSDTARILNSSVATSGGSSSMTVSACTAACKNNGFVFAGVEFGGECFCGNSIQNGGAQASSGCNMICTGNRTEYCGGSARMNLYQSTAPKQQLSNPGFESSGSAWYVSASSDGSGGLVGSFQSDSTNAHAGKGYFFVSGSQSSGTYGKRGICLRTELYLEKSGSYTLSFYTGGVDKFIKDPRSNIPPQYSLTVSASLAGSLVSSSVCEYGCPVKNVGGSPAYAYNTYTLSAPQGYQTLNICANYDGVRRGQDDYFFLDDVSLVGPL